MKKNQVKFDFEVPVYLTFIIPELLPLIVGKWWFYWFMSFVSSPC
jgi:hypothetical protein